MGVEAFSVQALSAQHVLWGRTRSAPGRGGGGHVRSQSRTSLADTDLLAVHRPLPAIL